jgi:hypothetical protein
MLDRIVGQDVVLDGVDPFAGNGLELLLAGDCRLLLPGRALGALEQSRTKHRIEVGCVLEPGGDREQLLCRRTVARLARIDLGNLRGPFLFFLAVDLGHRSSPGFSPAAPAPAAEMNSLRIE